MSNQKTLRILFAGICTLLALFLLSGIYFMIRGAVGAGLIGIGVSLVGTALLLFLGNGILFFIKDDGADASDEQVVNAFFTMSGTLGYSGTNKDLDVSGAQGTVYLTDSEVLFKGIGDSLVRISYENASVEYSGQDVAFKGEFVYGDATDTGSCVVGCGSVIKMKGLKQMLDDKVKGVPEDE